MAQSMGRSDVAPLPERSPDNPPQSAAAAGVGGQGNYFVRQFEEDYYKYNRQIALCDANSKTGSADPSRCNQLRQEHRTYLQKHK